jgi:hypothetical protein
MPSTKKSTKVANQIVPQQRISEITFYGPMSVMCWSELIVTDQEEFLSNFPNGVFDEDTCLNILSSGRILHGTYTCKQEIDDMSTQYDKDLTDVKIVYKN